jgi:O-antigen ligase
VPQLLGGVLTGITVVSIYGLGTRLFPNRIGSFDPIAGYRLEEPVGYWNALGILAAIGVVLALGQAARARTGVGRALAAAAIAVLLPTVYFTFSRGAWIALAFGILVAIAFERRRLQLVTSFALAAVAPALLVVLASRSDALTHTTASIAEAAHDGQRLAAVVVAAAVVSAGLVFALAAAERRVHVPRGVRFAYATLLVAAAAVALGAGVARYGSPVTMARDAYHRFTARPTAVTPNLNKRLFDLSGNGRSQLWKAAWQDYGDHSWLGSGAGTYEHEWYRRRQIDLEVRDAHNLYVEQLAELGPLGLGLLSLALALPLAAAVRARRRRLGGIALGAYVAFLLHAAVDWDWEMSVVTLAGLLCGVALLVGARGDDRDPLPLAPTVRFGSVGAAAALAALAFVGLVGNLALAASGHAAKRGDWAKAVAEAKRAADWAPWSAEAQRRLGEAELGRGNTSGAAAAFRRAVAKDPNDWQLQTLLYGATDGPESRAAYRRAVALNPRGVAG